MAGRRGAALTTHLNGVVAGASKFVAVGDGDGDGDGDGSTLISSRVTITWTNVVTLHSRA